MGWVGNLHVCGLSFLMCAAGDEGVQYRVGLLLNRGMKAGNCVSKCGREIKD